VAGIGGVVHDPRGKVEFTFSWNIGHATNNQAKTCVLYQCLCLDNCQGIHNITVIGDSKIIIRHARMKSLPSKIHLRSIFLIIQKEIQAFHNVEFLYVLRLNNKEANHYENQ
jgi:ribonuclease HI